MDYYQQPFAFRLKKALRYCRLYGLSRTYIKVQGRRHMARKCEQPGTSTGRLKASQVIGVIGCGNYSFANIAYYLTQAHGRVIGGCMDVDPHRAASLAQYYRAPLYTTDAVELIDHPQIRMLYVASNHASHAEYAIQALERGKDVYIEKPHVVNEDQLNRLVRAMESSSGRVYLGFNRPSSRFGRLIRQHLDQEAGPAMYSWFVAGHALAPDHWYHRPQEGGRVLGNLCHWTDFLYYLAGQHAFPVEIRPTCFDKPDVNIVVSLTFGDGSIGAITFSEKEEPFEGIKEKFCAHKGNCLIAMEDFQRMTVELRDRKRVYRNFFRDHGHRDNILGAFDNAMQRRPYDREQQIARIANTALLFLRTKEALERNQPLVVHPYQQAKANRDAA